MMHFVSKYYNLFHYEGVFMQKWDERPHFVIYQ